MATQMLFLFIPICGVSWSNYLTCAYVSNGLNPPPDLGMCLWYTHFGGGSNLIAHVRYFWRISPLMIFMMNFGGSPVFFVGNSPNLLWHKKLESWLKFGFRNGRIWGAGVFVFGSFLVIWIIFDVLEFILDIQDEIDECSTLLRNLQFQVAL